MEVDITKNLGRAHIWHAQLDTFLLYLLAAELGYFILLIVGGVVLAVLVFALDASAFEPLERFFNEYNSSFLWPVLPYIVALPLNMLSGLASLALTIRAGIRGYPGSGHLLNWLFLMTTAWLFLIAVLILLPGVAGSY